jgi:hypothetical protein
LKIFNNGNTKRNHVYLNRCKPEDIEAAIEKEDEKSKMEKMAERLETIEKAYKELELKLLNISKQNSKGIVINNNQVVTVNNIVTNVYIKSVLNEERIRNLIKRYYTLKFLTNNMDSYACLIGLYILTPKIYQKKAIGGFCFVLDDDHKINDPDGSLLLKVIKELVYPITKESDEEKLSKAHADLKATGDPKYENLMLRISQQLDIQRFIDPKRNDNFFSMLSLLIPSFPEGNDPNYKCVYAEKFKAYISPELEDHSQKSKEKSKPSIEEEDDTDKKICENFLEIKITRAEWKIIKEEKKRVQKLFNPHINSKNRGIPTIEYIIPDSLNPRKQDVINYYLCIQIEVYDPDVPLDHDYHKD